MAVLDMVLFRWMHVAAAGCRYMAPMPPSFAYLACNILGVWTCLLRGSFVQRPLPGRVLKTFARNPAPAPRPTPTPAPRERKRVTAQIFSQVWFGAWCRQELLEDDLPGGGRGPRGESASFLNACFGSFLNAGKFSILNALLFKRL